LEREREKVGGKDGHGGKKQGKDQRLKRDPLTALSNPSFYFIFFLFFVHNQRKKERKKVRKLTRQDEQQGITYLTHNFLSFFPFGLFLSFLAIRSKIIYIFLSKEKMVSYGSIAFG